MESNSTIDEHFEFLPRCMETESKGLCNDCGAGFQGRQQFSRCRTEILPLLDMDS